MINYEPMLKSLFTLNLSQSESLCSNQLVDVSNKSDYIQVVSRQSSSTPGVKTCMTFQVYQNVTYELRVEGVACRENMAFLWVMDTDKNRLFSRYTFLPSTKKACKTLVFTPTRCTRVYVGVLMTEPRLCDTFYLFSMSLLESCHSCAQSCPQSCSQPQANESCPPQSSSVCNPCQDSVMIIILLRKIMTLCAIPFNI